jgi:hypothetical protein
MSGTIKKKILKWGSLRISVALEREGFLSWRYEPDENGWGGFVSVGGDDDWATVSTDDYESTTMFPVALLPMLIRELKALERTLRTGSEPGKESKVQ